MAVMTRQETDPTVEAHAALVGDTHGAGPADVIVHSGNIGLFAPEPDLESYARLDGTTPFTGDVTFNQEVTAAASQVELNQFVVVARLAGASQTQMGAAGPTSEAGIKFGSAGDTNLYRSAADNLKTDDTFTAANVAAIGYVATNNSYVAGMVGSASQTAIGALGPASEACVQFGSAGDVKLYRSAADTLKTDDTFIAAAIKTDATTGVITVKDGAANSQIRIGLIAGIEFGSDVHLYRSAADTLKTDDAFIAALGVSTTAGGFTAVGGDVIALSGDSKQVAMGNRGSGSTAGIVFGSAADVNLYRNDAASLRTDDALYVGLTVAANQGAAEQVLLQNVGGKATIRFGSASDTNLYRDAADTLKTDDTFTAAAGQVELNQFVVTARKGGSEQTHMGAAGPTSEAGLKFGSASDTNLYRSAADTLKTDDTFTAAAIKTHATTGIVTVRDGGSNNSVQIGNNVASGKATIAFGADTQLHRDEAGVLAIGQNGGGLRLKSPDGLVTRTLTISNAGALVVA